MPSFVVELICLKDAVNCTGLGVGLRLLHHYLFRVFKKEKSLFRVSNSTAILVKGRKFQSEKYMFRVRTIDEPDTPFCHSSAPPPVLAPRRAGSKRA